LYRKSWWQRQRRVADATYVIPQIHPGSFMFRIDREHNVHSLLSDTQTWNSLAAGIPHRQSQWLGPWWDHFGSTERAYFIVARDSNDRIRAMMPLHRTGTLGRRGGTLAFVGSGAACSDDLSILCAPEDAHAAGSAMAQWLVDHANDAEDGWSVLDLDGIKQGDRAITAFTQAITAADCEVHGHSRMHTWQLPLASDWDTFIAGVSSHAKRRFRTTLQKSESTEGISFATSQTNEELREDLNSMMDQHQRRWVSAGFPGTYHAPAFRSFVHDAAQRFLAEGRLHLLNLRVKGQSLGAIFSLVGDSGALYGYSSGYDINHAEMEPGRLLSIQELKRAHDDRRPFIDYMRGDETYKQRMTAEPTRLIHLKIFAPSMVGKVFSLAWNLHFGARQLARRMCHGSQPLVAGARIHESQSDILGFEDASAILPSGLLPSNASGANEPLTEAAVLHSVTQIRQSLHQASLANHEPISQALEPAKPTAGSGEK